MTTLSSGIRTAIEQKARRCIDFATAGGMISGRRLLLEHVPQKWEPVLRKRTCSDKEIEQDDNSKRSHPALEPASTEHPAAASAVCAARVGKITR
jgi:hypothetical protein